MISNQIDIEISKDAYIEPILLDYKNDQLRWHRAVEFLGAQAQWLDTDNALAYGSFETKQDGTAVFRPNSLGHFVVLCKVSYTDFTTKQRKSIQQTLFINILNSRTCECEVEVSNKDDNRLVKETDKSLYVPELQVDLNQVYFESKDEVLPPISSAVKSEEILSEFATEVGKDIKELKESLDKNRVAVELIAGTNISALSCVYELDGVVKAIDYRDEDNIDFIIGIAITSAQASNKVTVQISGFLEDDFWNFVPGKVWLGRQGALTQVPPNDGFDVLVGVAVSPKKLLINLQDSIELE